MSFATSKLSGVPGHLWSPVLTRLPRKSFQVEWFPQEQAPAYKCTWQASRRKQRIWWIWLKTEQSWMMLTASNAPRHVFPLSTKFYKKFSARRHDQHARRSRLLFCLLSYVIILLICSHYLCAILCVWPFNPRAGAACQSQRRALALVSCLWG